MHNVFIFSIKAGNLFFKSVFNEYMYNKIKDEYLQNNLFEYTAYEKVAGNINKR
jgi:hypothetical protein